VTTPIGSTVTQPPPSLGNYDDDAMSALYTTIADVGQNELATGECRVEQDETQQQQEEAQERAALGQAQANQAHSGGGFFSEVGKFFSDVASDLVHGHFGSAIDDAGRDLEEAWNSPQFWSDLKTGLEDVAMVAAAVATTVSTAGVGAVAIAAAGIGAVAAGGAGLAGARVDHFAAAAEDANADATAADDDVQELQQETTDVLADMKQDDASHERAVESLTQSMQTNDETVVAGAAITVKG
jgi:hypothetical protein